MDLGSQYTHLIARRIREFGIYSEVVEYRKPASFYISTTPKAIILSGGPASVTAAKFCECDKAIFNTGIPVLGICYGAQLMAKVLGGRVEKAQTREYGKARLRVRSDKGLLRKLVSRTQVWMSHGDKIVKVPKGFKITGFTEDAPVAVMENRTRKLYGVQFHPEVVHTFGGKTILKNFLLKICGCKKNWNINSFIQEQSVELRKKVGGDKVLCALSGGVDSSVLAMFLYKFLGKNLVSIFIDNGLLRKNEADIVKKRFKDHYHMDVKIVNARRVFLKNLRRVTDPEEKRKIIGKTFIDVFEKEAKKISRTIKKSSPKRLEILAQGTLYPDVIESESAWGGPSATIKTHHNVGGLPEKLNFKLIEPFKFLFKDEVRILGRQLGLPSQIVNRHPFPGPGLAVRIIGEVTEQRLNVLREADWVLIDEVKKAKMYDKLWQSFCVLLPVKTVGVMGDGRTYEKVIAIRAVESSDAMTATWAKLPYSLLERVSNRIINQVHGVNRVVYDISSKPPSTIEWE